MNCWVCEKARPDYPIPADFLVDGRPVCRFHVSDLSPRAPLPKEALPVVALDERAELHVSLPLAAENHEGGNATMLFEKKELDLEALKADRAGGLTVAQLAEKYECGITTIRTRLNSVKPASAKRDRASAGTNGNAVAADADDLARLLDGWWQKLPVLERVRLLLARVPQ